tara:strand:- start:1278 stop:1415 length:138 start_codon:yes stop_codon:yes gene_type:complete
MAKAPKFGVNYYKGVTRRKRPGRHKKKLNKHTKRMTKRKYRGQGR